MCLKNRFKSSGHSIIQHQWNTIALWKKQPSVSICHCCQVDFCAKGHRNPGAGALLSNGFPLCKNCAAVLVR